MESIDSKVRLLSASAALSLCLLGGFAYGQETKAPEEPAKLVARNQAITIHSHWPGVKVTASGKALADGTLGESILIEQADSRERVLAKVTAPQTVEIRPATN